MALFPPFPLPLPTQASLKSAVSRSVSLVSPSHSSLSPTRKSQSSDHKPLAPFPTPLGLSLGGLLSPPSHRPHHNPPLCLVSVVPACLCPCLCGLSCGPSKTHHSIIDPLMSPRSPPIHHPIPLISSQSPPPLHPSPCVVRPSLHRPLILVLSSLTAPWIN